MRPILKLTARRTGEYGLSAAWPALSGRGRTIDWSQGTTAACRKIYFRPGDQISRRDRAMAVRPEAGPQRPAQGPSERKKIAKLPNPIDSDGYWPRIGSKIADMFQDGSKTETRRPQEKNDGRRDIFSVRLWVLTCRTRQIASKIGRYRLSQVCCFSQLTFRGALAYIRPIGALYRT